MIISKTRLKKIDDNTLQEIDKDGRTSLKWTSGFELVSLTLSNVRAHSIFAINDIDRIGYASKRIGIKPTPKDTIFTFIKPDPKLSRRIRAECLDSDDVFYRLVKEAENSDEYKCQEFPGFIGITLRECEDEPHKSKDYPKGVFYGFLWVDEDPDNTDKPPSLNIECHIPISQMDKLINTLNTSSLSSVVLTINVFSFREEMDKSFGEWWMTKYLLVEDNTQALISSVSISSVPKQEVSNLKTDKNKTDNAGFLNNLFVSPHAGSEKLLAGILRVLWIILIISLFHLLK